MKKILNKFMNQENVNIHEKMFRLVLGTVFVITLLNIVIGMAMKNFIINLLILGSFEVVVIVSIIMTFRYRRNDIAEILIGILMICGVLPMTFFQNGGVLSGAPIWFLMGAFYIFLLFEGKKLVAFVCLFVVTVVGCFIIAYQKPEVLQALHSKSEIYYDSIFAIIAVGITIGLLLKYQMNLYIKEQSLTLQQKKELESLGRTKDDFLAKISYEIRTPISNMMNLNELMMREPLSEKMMEYAQSIRKAGEELGLLVEDMLDYSSIERGTVEIREDSYELKDLLGSLKEKIQPAAEEKNLEFELEVDSKLPQQLIGDRKRLEQVLMNLLSNAVKFTEKGKVGLIIKEAGRKDNRISLKFRVWDTGIGIRQEDLENIYDSFKGIENGLAKGKQGVGFGLPIAKELVAIMGGKIEVSSIYKKGSHFTVTLEQEILHTAEVGILDEKMLLQKEKSKTYRKRFEASKARLLIVDGEKNTPFIIRNLLKETGVQIDIAVNGRECLQKTLEKAYDVILMESKYEDMSGMRLLHDIRLQKNGLCRNTAILVYTANSMVINSNNYEKLGFDGYLLKTSGSEKLEQFILEHLPDELVEYRNDDIYMGQDDRQPYFKRKTRRLLITSDSANDIPKNLLEEYEIETFYLYVETKSGRFMDVKEMNTDNLKSYMSRKESFVKTVGATVEEYEDFFSNQLENAEEIIHISLAANAGISYQNACEAAKQFANVHVIDSGDLSGGEALLTLYAADMVKEGKTTEEICEELEQRKKRIVSRFFLPYVDIYYKNGHVGKNTAEICRILQLHPIMRFRNSTPTLVGALFGREEEAIRRFVYYQLRKKKKIDNQILYITHTGLSVKQKNLLLKEINACMNFENIIMQKASVTCSSNGGLGTIGIAYVLNER